MGFSMKQLYNFFVILALIIGFEAYAESNSLDGYNKLYRACTSSAGCGIPGNDGPVIILAANQIVNTYFPGIVTAAAGTTVINVGTATGAAITPAAGDLMLVIQMQDGGSSPSFAGQYEYVTVTGFTPGTITIQGGGSGGGLLNTYIAASATASLGQQTFQVVRIPQYSALTIGATGSIISYAWDGSSGGIVALDIAGDLNFIFGGKIDVSGQGFRASIANSPGTSGASGNRGEGTAGSIGGGYPTNTDSNAAPSANEGGAGQFDTSISAGGGGANGGAGGNGGTITAPQGEGGLAFNPSCTNIIMGGSGGSGSSTLSGTGGTSGSGGGIVIIRTNSTSGNAFVVANGFAGQNSIVSAGGGGAGGTIVYLQSSSASTIVAMQAAAGNGGSGVGGPVSIGAGGGGGGTIIASSSITNSVVYPVYVLGGLGGTSFGAISGATGGDNGPTIITGDIATCGQGTCAGALCSPNLTVTKAPSVICANVNDSFSFTITIANNVSSGTAVNVLVQDAINPNLIILATNVSFAGGANYQASPSPTGPFIIPGGGTVTITYTASINSISSFTNTANALYLNPQRTISTDFLVVNSNTINLNAPAITVAVLPINQTICQGQSISISATPTTYASYQWFGPHGIISGATSPTLTIPNAQSSDSGTYTVEATDSRGCIASASAHATVSIKPFISLSASKSNIIAGTSDTLTAHVSNGTAPYKVEFAVGSIVTPSKIFATKTGVTSSASVNVKPLISTIYSARATDSNGCVSDPASPITIHVKQPNMLSVSLVANKTVVNKGQPVVLTATVLGGVGPFVAHFSNGKTVTSSSRIIRETVTVTESTTFTVMITDSKGKTVTSNAVSVEVNNLKAHLVSSKSVICQGQSVDLTVAIAGGTGPFVAHFSNGKTVTSTSRIIRETIELQKTTLFTAEVTDARGATVTSNSVLIKVKPGTPIIHQGILSKILQAKYCPAISCKL